jgi:nitroimidazol reductase NimA-like FMN-containing flavoprotein (pyridoxamine 5'-phosphate oxidase superfamily)
VTTAYGDDRVLDVLDEDECLALLAGASIGRLAFTEEALPAVQPVCFAVTEGEIVIPTHAGSRVAAASRGAVVAFEVDDVDAGSRTGWNVTVVGPSRVITDAAAVTRLDGLGVRSWAPGGGRCYISVRIRVVRGRRVHRG